jgi:hypothetical protein
MTAPAEITETPVVLTAHPLQRIGAFALAALARVSEPQALQEEDLNRAVQEMESDLRATTNLQDSKAPGGFWLGSSHLLWPNSPLSHPSRGKQSQSERVQRLKEWRTLPEPGQTIGVPCALCGRPACGYYGKVDVPLGTSTNYRNTTARGHEGMALCRGCLASFHALPYGCAISGGRAAVLHSWDDGFLRRTVPVRTGRMQRKADVAAGRFGFKRPYARQVAALYEIRNYEERFTAGVELLVFSNSNKEQTLDTHEMEQPLAEWLRLSSGDARFQEGWRYLIRAHHSAKVRGLSALARNLFDQPARIPSAAKDYLIRLAGDRGVPAGETPALTALTFDYAIGVLNVNETDAEQIRQLAVNIANVAARDETDFKKFTVAARKVGTLQHWLRRQAVGQILYTRQPDAFITESQWLLLFDSGTDSFLNRDLLLIATLEKVHSLDPKWRTDDPEAHKDTDDEFEVEEEEPAA